MRSAVTTVLCAWAGVALMLRFQNSPSVSVDITRDLLIGNVYCNAMVKEAMRQLFAEDAASEDLGNAETLTVIFPKGMSPSVGVGAGGTPYCRLATGAL